jgi:hypothetical protein
MSNKRNKTPNQAKKVEHHVKQKEQNNRLKKESRASC